MIPILIRSSNGLKKILKWSFSRGRSTQFWCIYKVVKAHTKTIWKFLLSLPYPVPHEIALHIIYCFSLRHTWQAV